MSDPQPLVTRQQLAKVFADPRTLIQVEALFRQANIALPEDVSAAEANAATANATANTANATANIANTTANTANATANEALAEADALTLPTYVVMSLSDALANESVLTSNAQVTVVPGVGSVTFTVDVAAALGYTPANIHSPDFSGVPLADTAAPGTNTRQLASTAFVGAAIAAAGAGVSSFNTRTGAVVLTSGDVTGALTYTPLNRAGGTMGGQLNIIDANYFLTISASNPTINFDTNDYLSFDRTGNVMSFNIAGSSITSLSATAARADIRQEIVDAGYYLTLLTGSAYVNFDVTDYLSYDRGSNTLNMTIAGSTIWASTSAGVHVTGEMQTDTLRINQAPTATGTASNYSLPVNLNGTTYYLRLSDTP